MLLKLVEVGDGGLPGIRHATALLAAVASDEATMPAGFVLAEIVDGHEAVVVAAVAAHGGVLDDQSVNLLRGKHGRALAISPISSQQCGAIGSHGACDIRAHRVVTRQVLKCPTHGVVKEGAALDDHLLAKLGGIPQLNDLEQGVLDNRVAQTRGDVANGGAFLLGLLDPGVHKDGATAAQVNRGLGGDGLCGKLLNRQIQAGGEGLNERPAARGAGLVEHDVLNDPVLDPQALHVLAANVQDELHPGKHLLSAPQMGHGLNLARIRLNGL